MSTIEYAPQKPKNFDNRKQDHGDYAEQLGHRYDDSEQRAKEIALREATHLKMSFEELQSTTPDEREAIADEILGETHEDIVYELPDFLKKENEHSEIVEGTKDEVNMVILYDEYESLYFERLELLKSIQDLSFEDSQKALAEAAKMQKELNKIEDQAQTVLDRNRHETLPSEAEVEKESKRAIRKRLARQATEDYDPDSDHGDYTGGSAMHISNNPR